MEVLEEVREAAAAARVEIEVAVVSGAKATEAEGAREGVVMEAVVMEVVARVEVVRVEAERVEV